MNQSQEKYTTTCKGCVFAEIEGDRQVACNVRVMEPSQYFYSIQDGVEYRIYKRLCQFKRTVDWVDDSDPIKRVKDEVRISYNAIIMFKDADLVLKTINNIKKQAIKPANLILVCYQKLGDEAQRLAQESGLKWVVHEILDDMVDWRDDVIQKFPAQFYAFIHQGYEPARDFFITLNDQVNFQDLRFGCIQSDNLLIFPHGLYKMVVKPLRVILQDMDELGFKRLNEDFSTKE